MQFARIMLCAVLVLTLILTTMVAESEGHKMHGLHLKLLLKGLGLKKALLLKKSVLGLGTGLALAKASHHHHHHDHFDHLDHIGHLDHLDLDCHDHLDHIGHLDHHDYHHDYHLEPYYEDAHYGGEYYPEEYYR